MQRERRYCAACNLDIRVFTDAERVLPRGSVGEVALKT
jgi:hypothetical protein